MRAGLRALSGRNPARRAGELQPAPARAVRAPGLPCPTQCVVGGDGVEMCIAAASIIAKVIRDRLMLRLDARHPGYGWASNAGYGAPAHLAALRRLGVTAHHRAGFAPVAALLAGN